MLTIYSSHAFGSVADDLVLRGKQLLSQVNFFNKIQHFLNVGGSLSNI